VDIFKIGYWIFQSEKLSGEVVLFMACPGYIPFRKSLPDMNIVRMGIVIFSTIKP